MTRHSLPAAAGAAALLVAWIGGAATAGAPSAAAAPQAGAPKPKPPAPSKQPPASKKPPAPLVAPVILIPKCWERSIYNLDGRVTTTVNDVSFEAPPAYRESFAFWSGRMKGGQRTELVQFLTTTQEPAEDGRLPFRRQVSRLQVDLIEQGQNKTPGAGFDQRVSDLRWEGALDPQCNVHDVSRTGAPEKMEELDQLSFELLNTLSPRLGERREMKPGDSYTETIAIPMPQRLSVKGLEAIGVIVSRSLTLREVKGDQAIFKMDVTYKADPATPPTAPRTSCTIRGGGTGEATFDRTDGLFIWSQLESRMTIELEAPLRRLPDQPEDVDPGTAKSHIELTLNVSGKQVVAKLFSPPEEGTDQGTTAPQEPTANGGT